MTGLTQISAIEAPAVLLDLAKLESNLSSMQQLADRHGVALRPHAKTHKSVEIAKRQLALGATGLTVATVGEALVFIRSGIRSITISRPMVRPSDFARLWAEPATAGADLRVVVDSARRVEVAAEQAAVGGRRLGVFIKIDVGLHRCGVDPDSAAPLQLARQIEAAPAPKR